MEAAWLMGNALYIGTAGWQLPKEFRDEFPGSGSHLERYAGRFAAVEINSTFYRSPRASTVERWAQSVPEGFRFSVKLPRSITHEKPLRHAPSPLRTFSELIHAFGGRLGPLLVQLPPSRVFSTEAEDFVHLLHEQIPTPIALEPRHPSWFVPEVDALLSRVRIARVAADPPRAEEDGRPGGHHALAYYRLHGAPRIYWSDYSHTALEAFARLAHRNARKAKETWFIFDNTALGAATGNALDLQRLIAAEPPTPTERG